MKTIRLLFAGILLSTLLLSLQPQHKPDVERFVNGSDSLDLIMAEQKMMALLYIQSSAEYKAQCIQAYAFARNSVERLLPESKGIRPTAVIFDIDETVLDNSPFEAASLLGRFSYPYCWEDWCQRAEAEPVPGAIDFIQFLRSKGITPVFITNRKEVLRAATKANLTKLGVTGVEDSDLLMRDAESSKAARRNLISLKYDILLLVGDNLADFHEVFDGGTPQDRSNAVQKMSAEFGSRFIVLPNPLYGNWENAIYQNGEKGIAEKLQARRNTLKACECLGTD